MYSKDSIARLNTFTHSNSMQHGGEINVWGAKLTDSIRKLILYINITGVSGTGALYIITKIQSTM